MFGYIKTSHPNTFVKDVVLYKSMYCGLCKSIGKQCGQKARFLLSYDLTFLSVFLHNVLGQDIEIKKQHCILHPITKREMAKPTELSIKIGALNVILAYYKLCDDVIDAKKGKLKRAFFNKQYKKAKKFQPQLDEIVKKHFNTLVKYEQQNYSSIDIVADPFGLMMVDIVNYFVQDSSQALNDVFYNLGKWIYLIDALDDFDKDLKSNNFNVFINCYTDCKSKLELVSKKSFDIASLFGGILNSISINLKDISFKFNHDLVDNILLLGLKEQTKNVLENKKCKNITKF